MWASIYWPSPLKLEIIAWPSGLVRWLAGFRSDGLRVWIPATTKIVIVISCAPWQGCWNPVSHNVFLRLIPVYGGTTSATILWCNGASPQIFCKTHHTSLSWKRLLKKNATDKKGTRVEWCRRNYQLHAFKYKGRLKDFLRKKESRRSYARSKKRNSEPVFGGARQVAGSQANMEISKRETFSDIKKLNLNDVNIH